MISILAVTAVAAAAILLYCAPCRGATLFALGRTNGCSLAASLDATSFHADTAAVRGQLQRIRVSGDGLELWATPLGEFWVPPGEDGDVLAYVQAELAHGTYGDRSAIRPGGVVIDCGAHIGMFTRHALLAGAGRVIAVEPSPANIACLRANFAAEIADGRVVLVPKGVWDHETVLRFNADDGNSARGSFLDREVLVKPRQIEVRVTTIDRIVDELGLTGVDFIKMDIEGSEPRAVAGAAQTLRRFTPVIAAAIYHSEGDADAVRGAALSASSGYTAQPAACENFGTSISPTTLLLSTR